MKRQEPRPVTLGSKLVHVNSIQFFAYTELQPIAPSFAAIGTHQLLTPAPQISDIDKPELDAPDTPVAVLFYIVRGSKALLGVNNGRKYVWLHPEGQEPAIWSVAPGLKGIRQGTLKDDGPENRGKLILALTRNDRISHTQAIEALEALFGRHFRGEP